MIWRFFINPIMIFILRSPLHFLVSHSVLVLYVTGAKTGKQYFIPVSFFEHSKGLLTCVTDKPNIWWRNLTSIDEIKILFKGKEILSRISTEPDDSDYIFPKLHALFSHSRLDGFFGGVGYKNGKPIEEDVIGATKRMVLIELDFTES
tara:strand:+ start:702 stop:1145 length:444 start_codon:yes stop_codon:yes gene_type:complete